MKIPERSKDGLKHIFPSLFVALQMDTSNLFLERNTNPFNRQIPYDLFCPSIQGVLMDRTCKICHLYFASQVMLRSHINSKVHSQAITQSLRRIQPTRVAARRQKGLMAIIAANKNEASVDWYDENELDLNGVTVPTQEFEPFHGFPLCSVQDHLLIPWEEFKLNEVEDE